MGTDGPSKRGKYGFPQRELLLIAAPGVGMLGNIGPFEILELIGRGGMGSVYRCLDPMIGRPVAVKVVRLVGYNNGEEAGWLKKRLLQEARTAGSLTHPGIVTIYQVGSEDDMAYIAMEYVDGPTLQARQASSAPLKAEALCKALIETAAALDYSHRSGVIHRDIKPANIILSSSGNIKVTDFGIAKTLLGHTATRTGTILGSPFYMSPEQIRGQVLDGRCDQFALAVTAYELLTGKRPFHAEQVTNICYQIVHMEPPSPSEINPALPSSVVQAIKRGLAKDPADRFPTCTDFATALLQGWKPDKTRQTEQSGGERELLPAAEGRQAERTADSSRGRSTAGAKRHWSWRHRRAFTYAAGLFVILVVAATWIWTLVPQPKTRSALRVSPRPPRHEAAREVEPQVAAMPTEQTVTSRRLPVEQSIGKSGEVRMVPAPERRASGYVIWTGQASRGTLLAIESGHASRGVVRGRLPGTPATVEVFAAERGSLGLTVFTSDQQFSTPLPISLPGFGEALFSWDPRHATDLVLWEKPDTANKWNRIVVLVNTTLTGYVVRWREISS